MLPKKQCHKGSKADLNFQKKISKHLHITFQSTTFASLLRKSTSSGCSAVRLAHLLWEQGVVGSNPATPTKKPPEKDFLRRGSKKREISYGEKYCSGCSAVRLARQLRELEVAGSNPVSPTKIKTFALKGKGFLLWAYDGYSSPKVRVQEKRIPLYQAGSLIFVHPIRDSSGSEAERRNPVFPTERRDTKTFLFSFPDSDMSHGKRTAIKNCLRNSFCLCISHQGAI